MPRLQTPSGHIFFGTAYQLVVICNSISKSCTKGSLPSANTSVTFPGRRASQKAGILNISMQQPGRNAQSHELISGPRDSSRCPSFLTLQLKSLEENLKRRLQRKASLLRFQKQRDLIQQIQETPRSNAALESQVLEQMFSDWRMTQEFHRGLLANQGLDGKIQLGRTSNKPPRKT